VFSDVLRFEEEPKSVLTMNKCYSTYVSRLTCWEYRQREQPSSRHWHHHREARRFLQQCHYERDVTMGQTQSYFLRPNSRSPLLNLGRVKLCSSVSLLQNGGEKLLGTSILETSFLGLITRGHEHEAISILGVKAAAKYYGSLPWSKRFGRQHK